MGNYFTTEKKLIIVRGLPGSGKTTLAKELAKENGKIYSLDDYFMENDKYNYNPKKYNDAQLWTQYNVVSAMKKGEELIILDNHNIRKWEVKPYVRAAIELGYKVEFQEPNTPWKKDLNELLKKSSHHTTRKFIKRMINKWEDDFTVENILASELPYDKVNENNA